MAKAKQIKSRYPGIYKVGKRYEWNAWRGGPRGMADTLGLARAAKAKALAAGGTRAASMPDAARVTFGEYALEWIAGYQGRTSRGFDEGTLSPDFTAITRLDALVAETYPPPRPEQRSAA